MSDSLEQMKIFIDQIAEQVKKRVTEKGDMMLSELKQIWNEELSKKTFGHPFFNCVDFVETPPTSMADVEQQSTYEPNWRNPV